MGQALSKAPGPQSLLYLRITYAKYIAVVIRAAAAHWVSTLSFDLSNQQELMMPKKYNLAQNVYSNNGKNTEMLVLADTFWCGNLSTLCINAG